MVVKLYNAVAYFPHSGEFASFGLFLTREEAEHRAMLSAKSLMESGGYTGVKYAVLEGSLLVTQVGHLVSERGKDAGAPPGPELSARVGEIQELRVMRDNLEIS